MLASSYRSNVSSKMLITTFLYSADKTELFTTALQNEIVFYSMKTRAGKSSEMTQQAMESMNVRAGEGGYPEGISRGDSNFRVFD